jgi:hypothetical protein
MATAGNADPPATVYEPDAVLAELLDGNQRFMAGELEHPRQKPADFVPLAEGQAPQAVIVGCADSRVAPELIFDQGVGDLFVVRVAGNVIGGTGVALKGSIEYAVAELGTRPDFNSANHGHPRTLMPGRRRVVAEPPPDPGGRCAASGRRECGLCCPWR